ncbi:disulfide bond formation protein B [Novosphingobium sp. FKTRR1]|uniref:disulfide bond formation protein B n=1 Tax=Novosphingobium sp. FKTRR1 TaxID=2879118 RepID=UPI001CF00CBA|nr:disulfide bond formation protein B [Novosphingobium sp. FKTRR1]
MAGSSPARTAHLLALVVPVALLGGAYTSQYGFGLVPCEMCWWQRYPHFAAIGLGVLANVLPHPRARDAFAWAAAVAILASGLIGAFHAGVEYGWWQGITTCSTTQLGADPLAAILNAPLVRCDVAQWTLFGISLAGYNFLVSTGAALAIFALLTRARKGAA